MIKKKNPLGEPVEETGLFDEYSCASNLDVWNDKKLATIGRNRVRNISAFQTRIYGVT
jgi:hypothetical protein